MDESCKVRLDRSRWHCSAVLCFTSARSTKLEPIVITVQQIEECCSAIAVSLMSAGGASDLTLHCLNGLNTVLTYFCGEIIETGTDQPAINTNISHHHLITTSNYRSSGMISLYCPVIIM